MATNVSNSSSNSDTSCSSETNWKIASGSLKNSVTFESSTDSPVDDSADSTCNSDALVLKPPSSDAGPCEIKLCFSQKHEVRQIYVRSTARVYEIYYAQSLQSDDEYLCTVRCSIAERDEQVLRAIVNHEFAEERTEGFSIQLNQEKFTGEGNNLTCEDDWVEVKVLDSLVVNNKVSTLPYKNSANRGSDIQDLYEATAEINDSDPCTSLTIRLLSVQDKGCVCIDEIYVFAEPVGPIDSENQAVHTKGSAGNSLMAMLVPTLLQLSKSSVGQMQGQKMCSGLDKGNVTDTLSKSTDLTEGGSEMQQHMKWSSNEETVTMQGVDGTAAVDPTKVQPADEIIINADKPVDPLVKNDSPYDRIEKVLEQLVSRVTKIEEVCLRFEENMLKPINSMEMRIQQVEQQLELLAKNSQHSHLPPGTRISAPSFPSESNCSSCHIEGNDYQPCGGPELEKQELNSANLFNQSDAMSNSVDAPNFLPSLVVTVPEFSCGEDEQDDDSLQLLRDSSQGKLNQPLIDDVLAAALSGFLSTSIAHTSECEQDPATCDTVEVICNTELPENIPNKAFDITDFTSSEESPKYTRILTVKAPEFTSEENGGKLHANDAQFTSIVFPEFDGRKIDNISEEPLPSFENESSIVNLENQGLSQVSFSNSIASGVFAGTSNIIPENARIGIDNEEHLFSRANFLDSVDAFAADEAKYSSRTDIWQIQVESGQRGPAILSLGKKDVLEHFLQQRTDNGSDCVGTGGSDINHTFVEGPRKDSLQTICKSSSASSIDFEMPILDVKFASQENSTAERPLHVLLGDVRDINDEANPAWVKGEDTVCTKGTNFIDIDYKSESTDPFNSTCVDLGIYDIVGSSNKESTPDDNPCRACRQDSDASLI